MSTRFLHIRTCDEDGVIENRGGMTVVYSPSKELDAIFIHVAFCHPNDNFCKKEGRKVALEKLNKEGPLDFVDHIHPISESVRLWIMQYFDVGLKKLSNGKYVFDQPNAYIKESLPQALEFDEDPTLFI